MAQWTVNPYVASSSLARGASLLAFFHGWEPFSGLVPVSCHSRTSVRSVVP
jgi:hypothetical protein